MLNSNEVLYGNFASSRRYGTQSNGFFHNGIDLKAPNNTGVKSRFAGVVRVTGANAPGKDFGNYIRVYHPQLGISSWYAHLLSFGVKVGQSVSQGQLIGQSNNTGNSTGPHLHYSESRGETTQWIDPDLTNGGDEMIENTDQADKIYKMLRPNGGASAGEIAATAGKRSYVEFLNSAQPEIGYRDQSLRDQAAQAGKVNELQAVVTTQANRIAELEEQQARLEAELTGATEALKTATDAAIAQAERIAELEKQLQDATANSPTPPDIADAIRKIFAWLKNIIGGGEPK